MNSYLYILLNLHFHGEVIMLNRSYCLSLLIAVLLLGCEEDNNPNSSTPQTASYTLSGTVSYGSGNEPVIIALLDSIPDFPNTYAELFLNLDNGSVDYLIEAPDSGFYSIVVWIDMDNSCNGVFSEPTIGDRMLPAPYYVIVNINGSIKMDFTDFPVVWPDAIEDTITSAVITIDGDLSDWNGVAPILVDDSGDNIGGINGTDLTNIYMVRNADSLFTRIDIANGAPNSALPVYYCIGFRETVGSSIGELLLFNHFTTNWYANVDEWIDEEGHHTAIGNGNIATGSNFIEMSYALQDVDNPVNECRYINAWCDPSGNHFDDTKFVHMYFP